jgi:hypothetical protein
LPNFDQAAVYDLFDKVQSHAMTLGLFERVNTHEPKSAPENGLWAAIWVQSIAPVSSSGLAQTSGRVELRVRIGKSFITKPEDTIDPEILMAAAVLIGEYSGNFTLGGTVRNVDLLGQHGTPLSGQAGYLTIGQQMYRVMEVTLPIIINDLWQQVP